MLGYLGLSLSILGYLMLFPALLSYLGLYLVILSYPWLFLSSRKYHGVRVEVAGHCYSKLFSCFSNLVQLAHIYTDTQLNIGMQLWEKTRLSAIESHSKKVVLVVVVVVVIRSVEAEIYMVQYAIFGNFHQNLRNFQNFDFAPIFHKILHMNR